MKKNIILIDYENVHVTDLKPLLNHDVLIKVFHGLKDKFTPSFTNMAIEFGKEKIELLNSNGGGRNALDFIIAYCIGKYSKEYENPSFHIISKDKDYKPLINFLIREEKISCCLVPSIAELAMLKPIGPSVVKATPPVTNTQKDIEGWYKVVLDKFSNTKVPKPKQQKTLRNQIINYSKKSITEDTANTIIQRLIENNVIECQNESVKFN